MRFRAATSELLWRSRRLVAALDVVLALTGVAATASLVLEFGFREPPVALAALHRVQAGAVAIFVLDRFLRLYLSRPRASYLRENWIDFALMALAAVALAISFRLQKSIVSAGALYLIITQAYILVALVIRAAGMNLRFAGSGIHPTVLLIGSFAFLCLAGSGLLALPAATPPDKPIYYADALFTAISATCVTGLTVRDIGADFTPFGQTVILVLIQLGGLGIMIFGTVLAMMLGRGLSIRGSDTLGQMVGVEEVGRMGRLVRFIVLSTLLLELAGAALLYPMFAEAQRDAGRAATAAQAVWQSAFHSVSAFCNAGFSLLTDNLMQGVRDGWRKPLRDHWQVLGVIAPLIVMGGLGFPVLASASEYLREAGRSLARRFRPVCISRFQNAARPRLTLHARVVLVATIVLIVGGAVGLVLIEPRGARRNVVELNRIYRQDVRVEGDWQAMEPLPRLREAVFQSISARTAGFNTVDMGELSDAGKFWMCLLMIVGGSPAGTAGGMKTVTLALLVLTVWSVLRRRDEVEVFGRSVSSELLRKNATLAALYLGLVGLTTLLLCVAMWPGHAFIDLLFEACSACGTVGLSAGVTQKLNDFGKYVIMSAMFVGRVGPLTLLLALTLRVRRVQYSYPTENVLLG